MIDRNSDIARAFRMTAKETPPANVVQGYVAPRFNGISYAQPSDGIGVAAHRLYRARKAVAKGKIYGGHAGESDWTPEGAGLRYVGRVVPDARRDWQDKRGDCGWYTCPFGDVFKDGSGLCFGVVYQLPARKGVARFVAGYEFGGVDGGPTLDFSKVYTAEGEYDAESGAYHSRAVDAADSAAKAAAESEREYQTAWRAGVDWADLKKEEAEARKEAMAILAERRKAKGAVDLPAICAALRGAVLDCLNTISEHRKKRAELAAGDADGLIFYPGESRLKGAFCEGAGLSEFPA